MAVVTNIICDMCEEEIPPGLLRRKVTLDLTGDKIQMQSATFDLHSTCVEAALAALRPLFKAWREG